MNYVIKFYVFLFLTVFSCANSRKNMGLNLTNPTTSLVEFVEIRRANSEIDLKEFSVINSTAGIKALYSRLNSGEFSKSVPIPVLENNQAFFLVLKPKLKYIQYGDIHIEKLEFNGSALQVNYKEIENWEYAEKKLSNPILILKVLRRPSEIELHLIK